MLKTLTLTTANVAVAVSVLRVPPAMPVVAHFGCLLAEGEERRGELET